VVGYQVKSWVPDGQRINYWCERCLLITESPKTLSHFRYLIWVLCYIPYTGLAVFSYAIKDQLSHSGLSLPRHSACRFPPSSASNLQTQLTNEKCPLGEVVPVWVIVSGNKIWAAQRKIPSMESSDNLHWNSTSCSGTDIQERISFRFFTS